MFKQKQTPVLPELNSTCSGTPQHAILDIQQPGKALRILRVKQLVERTQLSRATLYVLMDTDATFPQKIKLTTRTVGFLESEVDAWIAARAESRLVAQ